MRSRIFLALLVTLGTSRVAMACPFCNAQGTTLSTEFGSADLIVVATVQSATRDPEDFSKSQSVVKIEKMLKAHPAFAKATTLTLDRYIPQAKSGPEPELLLFCDVSYDNADAPLATVLSTAVFTNFRNMRVNAYRGDEIPAKSKLPDYLEATQQIITKPAVERLRFYFDHLESNELFISTDAYSEWGYADYKDVQTVAKALPAATLLKWLRDPATLGSRLGLYGMLLGHCGKTEDARELRKLLDDPENKYSLGLDGLLAGYTLLDPQAGWSFIEGLIADRKKGFSNRFAALRTVRFFQEFRPDVISAEKRLATTKQLVEQDDIADLAVDDFRKWRMWDQTEFVLGFADKESHNIGIVKRAMLKFALQSAAESRNPAALEFVEKARKADPKRVKLAEELLSDEMPKPVKKSG